MSFLKAELRTLSRKVVHWCGDSRKNVRLLLVGYQDRRDMRMSAGGDAGVGTRGWIESSRHIAPSQHKEGIKGY